MYTNSGGGGTFDFLSVYYPEDNRGKRREEIRGATNETASTEIPTEIPEHGNRASAIRRIPREE